MAELQTTLNEFRDDSKFLSQQVDSGKISFIALEYGPEIMKLMSQYSAKFRPMALGNFSRRGIDDPQLRDDAFLVFAGPAHYLLHTQPGKMKTIELSPIEDDQLMQKSLNDLAEAATKWSKAIGQLPEKSAAHVALDQSLKDFLFRYYKLDDVTDEKVLATQGEFVIAWQRTTLKRS